MVAFPNQFVGWAKPGNVLERAEAYLDRGYPLSGPLKTSRSDLVSMERVRNRISHESDRAQQDFEKVLRAHFRFVPRVVVSPGRFLNLVRPGGSGEHYMEHYARTALALADSICDGI